MAMGIAVGEEAALQHLVGGGTDAPAWSVPVQGRLLNFGEVIFGIAIQGNSADRYQPYSRYPRTRERPDLGYIDLACNSGA